MLMAAALADFHTRTIASLFDSVKPIDAWLIAC